MLSPPTLRHRRTLAAASAVLLVALLIGLVTRPGRFDADGPTPAPASAADPSGETMPIGDLDGWRQVFTDDFGTDVPLGQFPEAVADKWSAYPSPVKDTFRHGTYSPHKVVSVSNGVLNEYIHAKGRVFMVAAILPNVPNAGDEGQTYGRYAVRFKADPIDGYKMAWLLWPDSGKWPKDGEIDFPERNLDSTAVGGFVHHQGARRGSDQASVSAEYDSSAWHTAVIEWSPRSGRVHARRGRDRPDHGADSENADALGAADRDGADLEEAAQERRRQRADRLGRGLAVRPNRRRPSPSDRAGANHDNAARAHTPDRHALPRRPQLTYGGPTAAGGAFIDSRTATIGPSGMVIRPRCGRSRSKITRSITATRPAARSAINTPRSCEASNMPSTPSASALARICSQSTGAGMRLSSAAMRVVWASIISLSVST